MARTCVIFTMVLLSPFLSACGQSTSQASGLPRFVIDENRAYVYLRFDHVGKGVKFSEDEPTQRVWLRFVNNCRVGVVLRTFGPPEGSLKDEVGLMHHVVKDVQFRIHEVEPEPPAINATGTEPKQSATMPGGYYFDLGSAEIIPPGKSLLFSVPVSHLSKSWHMEIPYKFDLPPGKGPRPETIGGEPSMVLRYSAWDLPEAVQRQLKMR
jgi:hypothetical protein